MSLRAIVSACCPNFLRPLLDRIEESPLGIRLARGMFWSMAGAVISRGLMLVASIVVARLLGKTGFGELGVIQSTVGMFGVFAGFGLGLTATKHVAELRLSDPARAGRIIGISSLFASITGGLMAGGLFIFAPWLAENTINAPHLADALKIGAVILFISALNGAQTGALAGFEAFRTIAYVNLFVGLLSFPILIAGAYFGGLTGAVWALAINLCVNWLLNHLALRRVAASNSVPFSLRQCTREWPVLWRFSLPAALSGAMVGPINWVCAAILVNQPGGYGEMGIFNAANQWRIAILFIPGMVGQIVLPMLSSLNNPVDRRQYIKVLKYNAFLNGGAALIIASIIATFSYPIMKFYGPGFEEGFWVLICLAFTSVLMALNSVIGQAIASQGKMWTGFLFNAWWGIAIIIFATLLIYKGYGAGGLAAANLTAYFLHTVWQCFYLTKTIK